MRPGLEVEITREPVGVVGLITPWNFPIAIPAWKIAPALCLWQHAWSSSPPNSCPARRMGAGRDHRAARDCRPGVFNLVMGSRLAWSAQTLVDHPDVAAISFTGSVATGRKIAQPASPPSAMKKVQLEMGGKNPLVVLDDADLEGRGRSCAVQRRLFLDRSALHRLLAG